MGAVSPAVPPTPALIRAIREALDLSQTELGKRLGHSLSTQQRIERGLADLSATEWHALLNMAAAGKVDVAGLARPARKKTR